MNSDRLASDARKPTSCVLGVDLGLSGARACVVDEGGHTLGAGFSGSSGRTAVGPSAADQTQRWLAQVAEAVRSAVRAAGTDRLDAIAIGAFGPVPVVVDEDLCTRFIGSLYSAATPTSLVRAATVSDSTLGTSLWQLDVTGYVVSQLVGHPVMDRITAADHEGSELRIPAAGEPHTPAGSLTRHGAELLGLHAGVPVLTGTYDSFIDLAALGVHAPGDAGMLLGSTLVLGAVADAQITPPDGLRAVSHIGPGSFVGGWTSSAGRAVEWVEQLLGAGEPHLARSAATLDPGAGGLLALSHLAGERAPIWDDDARGVLLGLTDRTTPTQVYRSIVDSVALSALDLVERLREVTGVIPRWRAAGGGFRNEALAHAMADAIGVSIDVIDIGDGLGAALLAHRFLGCATSSLSHVTIEPDARRHERMVLLADLRRGVYDTLADRLHRLHDFDTPNTSGALS